MLSLDWTFGPGFAYKGPTAHGGSPKGRGKTMALTRGSKKLKKAKSLKHTKPLSMTGKHVCI
jgi:hypothetical protein